MNACPAMQYAQDVVSGRIVVGKWVQLAIERHLRDLETGEQRGLWFDERAAAHAIAFFRFLKHSKGEWGGQTIQLEPWQQFITWCLFGWKRADGARRFRLAYLEVARKNGKSTFASGIGLYLLDADGEPGAEVYTAATKRDQARITHSEATRMVRASPALRKRITIFKDNLHIKNTASKFEPLGRDANSMDGLNIHGAIVDELHAHRTREVWDVLETATGARRQPLMLAITTAGYNRNSVCYELHDYTRKVLAQVFDDDAFFGMIFTLDDGDDWENPANWGKANPNLGVSVKIDDLERKAAKAKELPSALNAFLRLHLNVWTQSDTKWIAPERWRACGGLVDVAMLQGRRCYGGLDLSSTTDITAFVLVFPPETEEERYIALCRFWIPEDAMHERSKRDRVHYDTWVRQGYMVATPGNVVDYAFIRAGIEADAGQFDLQEIAYDRWGATKLVQDLMDAGLTMVEFGQGFASMSAPMKELEKLILSGKLAHGDNPVLTWMADNLVARVDPAGNIKPDKARSIEKIDGVVALIEGLDRAIRHGGQVGSMYDELGIRTL
ncbi:MAG: terminase TerL endonuclease subunit [Caldilineaceae bacterium]